MGDRFQLTGASVILYRGDELLLQKRSDNHCWAHHGGKVEMGEVVEDAARREVLEETGLIVDSLRLFGVFSGPDLHHRYPDGNEADIIDIVFFSDDFHGEVKPQAGEVEELRWFPAAALPEKISPPARRALLQFVETRFAK